MIDLVSEKMNILPVPTWNHLGVNDAGKCAKLPKNFCNEVEFPLDISKLEGIEIYPLEGNKLIFKEEDALDKFVLNNKNAGNKIVVEGNVKEPIKIVSDLTSNNSLCQHNYILVKENSNVTIEILIKSCDDNKLEHIGLFEIDVKANSNVKVVQTQMMNTNSNSRIKISAHLCKNAKMELVRAELGSKEVVSGCYVNLIGDNSEFYLSNFYYGRQNQKLDFNDVINHYGKNTKCNIDVKGILSEGCKKSYKGTIDFKQGCSGSKGNEIEDVLLLSEDVENKTAPLILCSEENVDGTHAASIGKIDENQLFYLCTRGISIEEAKKLLILARVKSFIKMIDDENLRNKIKLYIEGSVK